VAFNGLKIFRKYFFDWSCSPHSPLGDLGALPRTLAGFRGRFAAVIQGKRGQEKEGTKTDETERRVNT